MPIIPPLFHKDEIATNFNTKAEIFKSFFVNQCSLISNNNTFPNKLEYLTQKHLSSIIDDIVKSIQNLDANKARGHDQISISMLKICSNSVCQPFEYIYRQCLETVKFQAKGKKPTVSSSIST